jgi:hypothetical protein
MTSFFHEHQRIKLSVSETGEGRAMLFQHGLCSDATQPVEVFPIQSGWRCVTLECRGHGRSENGPSKQLPH